MKRNISLVVLTVEIAAIVILHAVKMNQTPGLAHGINTNPISLSKSQAAIPVVKHYQLLSIK